MQSAFAAAAAVVPSLLLVWYFHARDRNHEPWEAVRNTFLLGVVIVAPILVVDQALSYLLRPVSAPLVRGLAEALLVAAIPEELFKFLVVTRYAARQRAFDEPMDGIVYGVIASLGFATLENVLYVADGGLGVAALRSATAVPGHAFTGAIMGYHVGRARFLGDEAEAGRRRLRGLLAAIGLHAAYDFPLLAIQRAEESGVALGDGLTLALLALVPLVLLLEAGWALGLVATLRREQDQAALRAAEAAARQAPGVPLLPNPPRPRPGRIGASVRLGAGGLLLLGSSFFAVALLLAAPGAAQAPAGSPDAADPASLAIAFVLFVALPAALGAWLFHVGLRRVQGRS